MMTTTIWPDQWSAKMWILLRIHHSCPTRQFEDGAATPGSGHDCFCGLPSFWPNGITDGKFSWSFTCCTISATSKSQCPLDCIGWDYHIAFGMWGSFQHASGAELINAHAEIDAWDKRSSMPLMQLMHHPYPNQSQQQMDIIFHLLLSAGCDINAMDYDSFMPLCYACSHNDNIEMFNLLIKASANLICGEIGHLLHCCVVGSVMNKLCILLNCYGIDLYLRNQSGETALHTAVYKNKLDIVQIGSLYCRTTAR